MPWPKGISREFRSWGEPPSWVAKHSATGNLTECSCDKVFTKYEQEKVKRDAIITYVESGEHLIADRYNPGQRKLAETEYLKQKSSIANRKHALADANKDRHSERLGNIEWIKRRCADILGSHANRKAMVIDIQQRYRNDFGASKIAAGTLYRHLVAILGPAS